MCAWDIYFSREQVNLISPSALTPPPIFAYNNRYASVAATIMRTLTTAFNFMDTVTEPAQAHTRLRRLIGSLSIPR